VVALVDDDGNPATPSVPEGLDVIADELTTLLNGAGLTDITATVAGNRIVLEHASDSPFTVTTAMSAQRPLTS